MIYKTLHRKVFKCPCPVIYLFLYGVSEWLLLSFKWAIF